MINHLKAEREEHLDTINKLNDEIISLNSKIDKMTKNFRMLNRGIGILEDILQQGKAAGDMSGLGFNKEKETISDSVHHASKSKPQMLNRKPRYHGRRKFRHWRCYHYGCFGHIKLFYFNLYGYPQITPRYRIQQVISKVEKHRMSKVVNTMPKVKK